MDMSAGRQLRKWTGGAVAVTLGIFIFLVSADAEAFQVKRVVRGSFNFAVAKKSCEVDVTESSDRQALSTATPCIDSIVESPASSVLDLSKTLLLFRANPSQDTPDRERVAAYFGDNGTIHFKRYSTNIATIKVTWVAIEFESGVTVRRGTAVFGPRPSGNTKVIDFSPSLDVTHSLAFVEAIPRKTDLTTDDDKYFTVTAEFSDISNHISNQLSIKRDEPVSGNGQEADVWYQMIEFDRDVTVQSGTTAYAAGSTEAVTQAITSVGPDTSKSFLHFMVRAADPSGDYASYAVEGKFNSPSQLNFQRNVADKAKAALNIVWYAATFSNETYIQGNTTKSALTLNKSSTPVFNDTDPLRTILFYSARNNTQGGAGDGCRFTELLHGSDPPVSKDTTTPSVTFSRTGTGFFSLTYYGVEFPPVDVIAPNGNEVWQIGSVQSIQWRRSDDMESAGMNILLSVDGGASYPYKVASNVNVGGASCDSSGLCSWTWNPIQEEFGMKNDVFSSRCKIKLDTNYKNTTRNFDISNSIFKIKPKIKIVKPAGGELWYIADEDREVEFDVNGKIGYVRLVYSTNSGSNYTEPAQQIGSDYNSDNCVAEQRSPARTCKVAWKPIPDLPYTTMRVKVYDLATAWVAATKYSVGDQVSNNGSTYVCRAAHAAGIFAADLAAGKWGLFETDPATSAADFEIRPKIKIVKPNDTQTLVVYDAYTVQWTTIGSVGKVNLFYSDGGVNYVALPGVTNPVTPTDCTKPICGNTTDRYYTWTLSPATLQSEHVKLKIEKSDNANANDTGPDNGDAFFSIIPGVNLTAPAVGTILRVGQDTNVTWAQPGGLTAVRITYTKNWSGCLNEMPQISDTSCWITMATPTSAMNLSPGTNGSTYLWQPPDNIGTNLGIRIFEKSKPAFVYSQNGAYTLKGKINVKVPNISTFMRVGGTSTITWDAYGTIGNVSIDLDKNNDGVADDTILGAGLYKLAGRNCVPLTVDASAGSFTWGDATHYTDSGCKNTRGKIPYQFCTNGCTVKVYKPSDPDPLSGTAGVSAKFNFSGDITNVTVVEKAPYGIGQTVEIRWEPKPPNVSWGTARLKYTVDNGSHWMTMSPGTNDVAEPGTSFANYLWTIPNDASFPKTTVRVRVELVGDEAATFSDSPEFAVKRSVLFSGDAKNGSATPWLIGQQKSITWTRNGAGIGDVRIQYSLDGGVDGYPYWVATAASADESYAWCVGYGSDDAQNYSDCGTPSDPGATNAHHPNWVIAGDRNGQIKFKIEVLTGGGQVDGTVVGDHSSGNLIIQKQFVNVGVPASVLEVSNPEDNSTFTDIAWATKGKSGMNVLLRYDTGGNAFPYNVNAGGGALSDVGGYRWQVPDAIGYNSIKVRVKSETNGAYVYGDSSAFTIKGKILALYPAGTDTLVVGLPVPGGIQYKKLGTLGNLEIIYDHDGNRSVITPVAFSGPAGASGETSFAWTVAPTDSLGASVIDVGGTKKSKFKITGLMHKGDANLEATVEMPNFQIRGDICDGVTSKLVKEPRGGEVYKIQGGNQSIRWQSRGILGNLRIRLDLNEGRGDDDIANTADDFAVKVQRPDDKCGSPPCYAESVKYTSDKTNLDGFTYLEWLIPNLPTTKARIRIESLDNPYDYNNSTKAMATYAQSEANFSILGSDNLDSARKVT